MKGRGGRGSVGWLVIGVAAAGCGREVLVAGDFRAPDASPPAVNSDDAGVGAPIAPRCNGSLFASNALPPVQMADQAGRSVAGDWNGDKVLDLAMVNANLGSVSVVLGKGGGTFLPRTDYPTGPTPVDIASGDLNGDRVPDLVILNQGAGSVTVLLGKGNGTFGSRADYLTSSMPKALALGDWTSDGRLDLIAGGTLFVGKGDGTFARGQSYGYDPIGIATGDLDHDGHLDLVMTVDSEDAYVLLGNGDGTFTRKSDLPLLQWEDEPVPTLGDLDGDGTLDVLINSGCPGEATPHAYTFLGAGDGSFRSETQVNSPLCGVPLAIADVNGDGKADVEFDGQLSWLGNGDGTFAPYPYTGSSTATTDTMLGLADWNGDGKLDVAMLDRELQLKVLPGRGDGMFGRIPFYIPAGDLFATTDSTLFDLTGDGAPDVLAIPPPAYGGVNPPPAGGEGPFGTPVPSPEGARQPLAIGVSDLDGDGTPDLVGLTPNYAGLSVWLGKGHGTLLPTLDAYTPTPPLTFAIGDVNGDGIPDLVSVNESVADSSLSPSFSGGTISVLIGWGDGTFGNHIDTPVTVYPANNLVLADLDGDHRLDAVLGTQLLLGNGDGTFTVGAGPPGLGRVFAAADLNHDGNTDLLAQNSSATVGVWLGTGGGNFGAEVDYPVNISLTPYFPALFSSPVLADFDGDGALDLALATGQITILHGAGDGTFACIESYDRDFLPVGLYTGDVNHDGKADLVTSLDMSVGMAVMVFVSH